MKKTILIIMLFSILPLGDAWWGLCYAQKTGCIQLYTDPDYQIMCISPNGKWACGIKQNAYEETGHGFRWNLTTDKIELISENSEANKVTDDGVVAGGFYTRIDGKNVERAGLWNGSWTELDVPDNAYETWATAITPDGKYITGCCYTTSGQYRGYVWNNDGSVLRQLEYLYTSMPTCISADGSMVGGWIQPYNRVPGWWNVDSGKWTYIDESLKGGPWFQVRKIYSNDKDMFYYGGYTLDPEQTDSVWGLKSFYNIETQKTSFIYPLFDETPYSFEMFDTDESGNIAVGYEQALESSDLAVIWEKNEQYCENLEDWLSERGADFEDYGIAEVDGYHYLCRCICVSGDGKKFGLDYYDTDYNVCSMIVMLDQDIYHNCPLNPEAVQVTGLNAVHLTWYTPLGDKSDLTGYDIYRNGVKVGTQLPTSEEVQEYYDKDVAFGTYTYSLKAVYSDGESEFSDSAEVTVGVRPVQAPQSLLARQRGYNSSLLMWALPKTNMIPCSYIDDATVMNSFGGGEVDFESGTLFDAETMSLYKDYRLTAVSFMPRSHQASWVVNIYTHEADGSLKKLMSKSVYDDDLNIGEFNTISLPRQVQIPEGQDMLIGIQTYIDESSYDVQAVYQGCLIEGKTDLIRMVDEDEDFYSINEMGYSTYDMAWATTALFAAEGESVDIDDIDHFNVYLDGSFYSQASDLKYVIPALADGSHTMAVDAVYTNGSQSGMVSTDVTIQASASSLPAVVPTVTTSGLTMNASWEAPLDNDASTLGWCSDVNGSSMPHATEDVPAFYACADFYSEEHKPYDDYQVESVSFKPMSNASFSIYLEENNEIVGEAYPEDITIGSWNTVALDEPVRINKGSLYSLVIFCDECPADEAPLATDANDAANDHSDYYMVQGESSWYNLSDMGSYGNWMMRLNLVDPYGEPFDATFDILLDGSKECSQSALSYSKAYTSNTTGRHDIQVNALYNIDGRQVTREGTPVSFQVTTSGIEELSDSKPSTDSQLSTLNSKLYNIAGQRVNAHYNGILIHNHKKIIRHITAD